ncbi:hypothetical protein BH11CYA1_BH11CYA1_20600 [soil metagenome]
MSCMTQYQKTLLPLSLALSLVVQVALIPSLATAKAKPHKAMAQNPKQRYEHLSKLTQAWDILRDSQVKAGIRRVMGNREEEYWNRSQLLDDSGSRGDEILIAGDVRGLGGSLVSLLYINRASGRLVAGYNDGSFVYLYGIKDKSEIPAVLQEYLSKTLPEKSIRFAVADHTPLKKDSTATKSSKPLNLTNLTGTYERAGGRFNSARLNVEELPGGQIRFRVVAYNGGNSGQAEGTIKLVNNCGAYKQESSKIQIKFAGAKATIDGDDSYFCGNAVTLRGTYDKDSDKKPDFRND